MFRSLASSKSNEVKNCEQWSMLRSALATLNQQMYSQDSKFIVLYYKLSPQKHNLHGERRTGITTFIDTFLIFSNDAKKPHVWKS